MHLAAIVSCGMSRIGRFEGLTGRELFLEAWKECLERQPNLDTKKIGAVYVGNQSEVYEHQIMYGAMVAESAGLLPKPAIRVEGCAAAGGLAVHSGVLDILSGAHDMVLVCGLEKMTNLTTQQVTDTLTAAADSALEQRCGLTIPSIYAMMATSHFHRYGSTERDLALVAVKNHENALSNPKAHLRKRVTVEDVLASKPVAWPLKLLDCSPISDGAAVMVLAKPDLAATFEDPVYIEASAVATDTLGLYQRDDICWPKAAYEAVHQAYRMAHLEPRSINLAELHDCFTINEIILSEACGFAPRGTGHTLLGEGDTLIGGKIPINTSGGLKARGHPTGATGVAQLYELYLQLRGEASGRQVNRAEVALAVNEGGSNTAVTAHVLKR